MKERHRLTFLDPVTGTAVPCGSDGQAHFFHHTLARPSQPPRPNNSHCTRPQDPQHWCVVTPTPHPRPCVPTLYHHYTTTIPPRTQGYVLKLPSKFLQQHGSKIRDGLTVLKLVSPITLTLTLILALALVLALTLILYP